MFMLALDALLKNLRCIASKKSIFSSAEGGSKFEVRGQIFKKIIISSKNNNFF